MRKETVQMCATSNLKTGKRRVYINGKRVSESRFSEYRAFSCLYSESTATHRRSYAVGVRK